MTQCLQKEAEGLRFRDILIQIPKLNKDLMLMVPSTSLILILLTPFTLPYIEFQKFIAEIHIYICIYYIALSLYYGPLEKLISAPTFLQIRIAILEIPEKHKKTGNE